MWKTTSAIPITPTRRQGRDLTSGHTTPKRVLPRTLQYSPYSERLMRLTAKTKKIEETLPQSRPDPIYEHSECSPHRYPLPRYQKRPAPQTREDPAVSAIRNTYAEEVNNLIPYLIGRMERLSLEDCMVWEDVSMDEVDMRDTGHTTPFPLVAPIAYSTPSTSASFSPLSFPPALLPSTPITASFNLPSSVDSSPGLLTPQPTPLLPLSTLTPHDIGCTPIPHEHQPMLSEPTITLMDDDDSGDELMRQLEASIDEIPTVVRAKSPVPKRQPSAFSHQSRTLVKPKKSKPVSKEKIENALKELQELSKIGEGSSTSQQPAISSQQPTVPSQQPAAPSYIAPSPPPPTSPPRIPTPPPRRRRTRATESMIWDGVDTHQSQSQSRRERKHSHRSAHRPYSQDLRAQRARRQVEDQDQDRSAAVPRSVMKSGSSSTSTSDGTGNASVKSKSKVRRRVRFLKPESLHPLSLSRHPATQPSPPSTPSELRTTSAYLESRAAASHPEGSDADDVSEHGELDSPPRPDRPLDSPTPKTAVREEDAINFIFSSIPTDLLFPDDTT